ncbi:MAG: DUF5104 domain-containing protein [Clostridiales bacterium]|nr:DUF5104 domain-containing protein [Clostridiales bacterium]MDR2751579.1 DUF5104 domain-containing protein [Clostridiales bacterium]
MKSFWTSLLLFAALFLVCGCAAQSGSLDAAKLEYSETRLLGILAALESKDKAEVLKLFSETALQVNDNIDEEVDEMMAFYEGTHGFYEGNLMVEIQLQENANKVVNGKYWVATETDEYLICFTDQVIDDNPLNVGLSSIQVVKESDLANESEWRIIGDESLSKSELWP